MNIQSHAFTLEVAMQSLVWMVKDPRSLTGRDQEVYSLMEEGKSLEENGVDPQAWLARVREINRALSLVQIGVSA